MKFTTRIIYMSLIVSAILVLRSIDIENDPEYLNIKSWTAELCSEFGSTDVQTKLVTDDERENVIRDIRDMSSNSEIRDMVQIFLDHQTLDSGKFMSLLPYIVPWLALLTFSIIGWFCYCSYCICDQKCPPSQCCRRNFDEQPYTKKEILIPIIIGLVLNSIILGASIAGLVVAANLSHGVKATRCSLLALFYDIQYSSSANKFPGLNGILTILNTIKANIDYFQSAIINAFSAKKSEQIQIDKDALVTLDRNAQRGGPSSTLPVQIKGQETYLSSNYVFDYILSGSTDTTFPLYSASFQALDTIYKSNLPATPQLDLINGYFDALINITQSLETFSIAITGADFKASLISGIADTQDSIDTLESSAQNIYENSQNFEDYSIYFAAAFQGLFGALIGLSIMSLVSIIMLQFMKKWKMRIAVHITWCFYCLLMIFGFMFAAILHPSSVVFDEVCWYMDSYINDKDFNANANFISDTTTKDIVTTCIFGPGNIFLQLKLEKTMSNLKLVTDQIIAFNAEISLMNGGEQTRIVNAMYDNLRCLSNILDGTVIDLDPVAYESFFNTWTPASFAKQANLQRYTWQRSYDKEKEITDQFKVLRDNFWAYINDISAFVAGSNEILTSIIDPNIGLMGATDCLFLKTSFQRIIDGLCVIFVPALRKTTVIIMILSIAMFFGSLTNFCIGLRFFRQGSTPGSHTQVHNILNHKEWVDEVELNRLNIHNVN